MIPPEIVQRQIGRLLELGFHRRLGLSAEAYTARFPPVKELPYPRDGRFNLLVAVEASPLIDLSWQHAALGIRNAVQRWPLKTEGPQPADPYFIWTHDGKRPSSKSMAEARGRGAGCGPDHLHRRLPFDPGLGPGPAGARCPSSQ